MINRSAPSLSAAWFSIQQVDEKIRHLQAAVHDVLSRPQRVQGFHLGRDLTIVDPAALPAKPGLSSPTGQARLLHDLASIELQAMELAVRTLCEFPEAPSEFREQLAEIAISEGEHLALCLRNLRELGFEWGHWPAHLALWQTVASTDSLLTRVLIVHRYLEGSGLDAGASILRRLSGVADKATRSTVQRIVDDEIDHVAFGSRWYHRLANQSGIDPETDFRERMAVIAKEIPRRERLARELRRRAGFTERELSVLDEIHPCSAR